MNIIEGIKKSVNDPLLGGKIVDNLRFNHGYDYNATRELFLKHIPNFDAGDFEQLMYQVDTEGNI